MRQRTCAQPGDFGGICGDPTARSYMQGPACRFHAPGATEDACQHGTPWAERCGRCEGEPPAPSTVPSPSLTREQHPYGPSADYSDLTIPMVEGRRHQIRRYTMEAPAALIRQRFGVNTLAFRATNPPTD